MSYRPRADSLPGRVCRFFERNPHEELAITDVAEKFGVEDASSLSHDLQPAVRAGLLERTKVGGRAGFRKGPKPLFPGVSVFNWRGAA